jgi:hypothetical protein
MDAHIIRALSEDDVKQLFTTTVHDSLLHDVDLGTLCVGISYASLCLSDACVGAVAEKRLDRISTWKVDAKTHMDQIDELIQREQGETFDVSITRLDGESFTIQVAHSMNVLALQRRIQRVLAKRIEQTHGRRRIDWYAWYCL